MSRSEQKIVQYLNEAHATRDGARARAAVPDRDDAARDLPHAPWRPTWARRATTPSASQRALSELGRGGEPADGVVGRGRDRRRAGARAGQDAVRSPARLRRRGEGAQERQGRLRHRGAGDRDLHRDRALARSVGDERDGEAGRLDPRRRGEDARADHARDPQAHRRRRGRRRQGRPVLRRHQDRRRRRRAGDRQGRREDGRKRPSAPRARPARSRASRRPRVRSRAPSRRESDLAIAGYDKLTAEEIVAKLSELSQIDLAKVDSYERKHQNRTTVLERITSLRGDEPWPGYDELTVAEVQAALGEADDDRDQGRPHLRARPQEPRRRAQGHRARARHRLGTDDRSGGDLPPEPCLYEHGRRGRLRRERRAVPLRRDPAGPARRSAGTRLAPRRSRGPSERPRSSIATSDAPSRRRSAGRAPGSTHVVARTSGGPIPVTAPSAPGAPLGSTGPDACSRSTRSRRPRSLGSTRPFGHGGARPSSFTAVNAPTSAWIDLRPEGTILSTYDTTTPGDPGQTRSDPNGAGAKAHEAAGQAQEKAHQAAGQARNRVRDEVDTRSTQAGQQAETVASDVRSVSEHLRSEGKDKPAELADKAAARVAELGDYLKRSDGDAILRDVERLRPRQALGRHGRRRAARHRGVALPEGVEQPPLPRAGRAPRTCRRVPPTWIATSSATPRRPRPCPPRCAPVPSAYGPSMSTNDTDDPRDRPIGELVKDLAGQTSTLVRQEIQLAQAEISTEGQARRPRRGHARRRGDRRPARPHRAHRGPDRRARHRHAAVAGGADRDGPVGRDRRRPRRPAAARSCSRPHRPYPNRPLKP